MVDKKQAAKEFKERKVSRGIYCVRCSSTGKIWVGSSRNLEASHNGSWFMLRSGSHHQKDLQAEWNAQGEQAFGFEILLTLDDETHALAINDRLKQERSAWTAHLSAQTIL